MTVASGILQAPQPFELQNFPFTDIATMRSSEGVFIPPSTFLDARIYPANSFFDVRVKSISSAFSRLVITLENSGGDIGTATVTDFSTQRQYVPVLDMTKLQREVGVLLLNPVALRAAVSVGKQVTFSASAMQFVPAVVYPQPIQSVSGIVLDSGDIVVGDVWLLAEDGVHLGYTNQAGTHVITVSVVSEPYFLRKLCEREGIPFTPRRPLKTLRVHAPTGGVYNLEPNQYGNVFIRPSDTNTQNIVRIDKTSNGMRIAVVNGRDYEAV